VALLGFEFAATQHLRVLVKESSSRDGTISPILTAVLLSVLCAWPSSAEIIPANRSAPWQGNVGVPGGIPARTTIYKNIVTDLGADPTGAQDCAPIMQRAINSCPPGQVVYIPAGIFKLDSRVYTVFKQNFTLRGAGAGVTIIKSNASNGYFLFGSQQWPPPSTYIPIIAGATTGSNTITVSDTSAFSVDQPMSIAPAPLPVWAHNLGGFPDSSHTMRITFKVRSKTSTTVTFDPPCPFDFSGMNPQARPFKGPADGQYFVQGVGVEDLTMDMSNSTTFCAIEFEQAWGCWIKGVEVNGAYSRQMRFGTLVRGEIRECYTHDTQGSGPNHEGIDFDGDCCWNLVEDNICNKGGASPIQFGDSTGANSCNVVAYNYVVNTDLGFWDISFNHNPHDMLNLAEGNVIDNFKDDGYFGSSSHNTLFRNRIAGQISLKHFSNYYNIAGNVLGTTGVPAYETEQVNYNFITIYELGFPNIGNHFYAGITEATDPPNYHLFRNVLSDPDNQKLDRNVKATILRHGNFDYFNNSTIWDPAIPDHTIPASLYLIGKPSWWGLLPWPAIGSDLNPMVSQIPAEYRFVNGRPTPPPTSTSSSTPSSPQNPQITNNKKRQYNKKKPKIQKQKWPSLAPNHPSFALVGQSFGRDFFGRM
jgi:hypothetical protein